MTVLELGDITKALSQPRKLLAAALTRLAEEKTGRYYQTFVRTGHHDDNSGHLNFTLLTASKDIHLQLGRLSFEEQIYFCHALNEAFAEAEKQQHVLVRGHKDVTKGLILVSRSQHGTDVTFILIPAR